MVRMASQQVVLHRHELSYVDSGTGPAVLFIHGILGSQRQWTHLVDKLDDNYRVVVPDLFGHGESAKPMGDYSLSAHAATLRDLLDHLGIARVTLVGHSLGGGIAMQFYYLFPERVDRLVLVSSGGLGRELNLILRSATLPGAETVLSVVASAPLIWQGFTSLSDRESRRAFLATTRAVVDIGGQSISAHDHLESVEPVPTLIVWGTKDRMIPAWHALSAQQAVPDCRVELFEGAGHFPHLEDPDRFAGVLREFIASDSTAEQPTAG
jgi:pimeloyl-ACP methyl ester carboxylesterase